MTRLPLAAVHLLVDVVGPGRNGKGDHIGADVSDAVRRVQAAQNRHPQSQSPDEDSTSTRSRTSRDRAAALISLRPGPTLVDNFMLHALRPHAERIVAW